MRHQASEDMATDTEREERSELAIRYVPWSPEEDELLTKLVEEHGPRYWTIIAQHMPNRNSKSCRLRWVNQLRGDLKKGNFTPEEDEAIIRGHFKYGNKWTLIAKELVGRTDNAIKNRWHSTLRKRLAQQAELREQLISAAGIAEIAGQPQAAQLLHHLAANIVHNPEEAAQLTALLASMSGTAPASSYDGTCAAPADAAAQAAPQLLGAIAARAGLMLEPTVSAAPNELQQSQLLAQLQGVLQKAGVLHNSTVGVQPAHGELLALNPTGQAAGSSTTLQSAAEHVMTTAPAAAAASTITTVTSRDRAGASSRHRRGQKRSRSTSHQGSRITETPAVPSKVAPSTRHQAPYRQGSSGSTDGGLASAPHVYELPAQPPEPRARTARTSVANMAAAKQPPVLPAGPPASMASLLHSLTPDQLVWLAHMKRAQEQGVPIPTDVQAGPAVTSVLQASSVTTSSCDTEGVLAKRSKREPSAEVSLAHAAAPPAAQLTQMQLAQQHLAVLAAEGAGANPFAASMLTQLASVGLQAIMAAQHQAQQAHQAQQQALQSSMLQAYLQRVSEQQQSRALSMAAANPTALTASCGQDMPATMLPAASSSMAPPARRPVHIDRIELDDTPAGPAVTPRINTSPGFELPSEQQLSQFCFDMDAGELLGSFNTPMGSFGDLTALLSEGKAGDVDAPFSLPQSNPNLTMLVDPVVADSSLPETPATADDDDDDVVMLPEKPEVPNDEDVIMLPTTSMPTREPSPVSALLPALDTLDSFAATPPLPPLRTPEPDVVITASPAPTTRASTAGKKAQLAPAAPAPVTSPRRGRKASTAAAVTAASAQTSIAPAPSVSTAIAASRSTDAPCKPFQDAPFGAACAFFGHHLAGIINTRGETSSCATSSFTRQNSFAFASGLSPLAKDGISMNSKLPSSTLERSGSASLTRRTLAGPAASRDPSFTSRSMPPPRTAEPKDMLCGPAATAALLMGVGKRAAREPNSMGKPADGFLSSPVPAWLAKAPPAAPLGLGMFESLMANAFVTAQSGSATMD